MGQTFSRLFAGVFCAAAFVGYACDSGSIGRAGDEGPAFDSGAHDAGAFDAASSDLGPENDGGPDLDTGLHPDAGSPEPDSGPGVDSGPGPMDGGSNPNRSPGCGMAQTPGQNQLSMMVGGMTRTYYLSVPQNYDASVVHPLVLGLHGGGGTGMSIRTRGVEMEEAMNTAVFVYPDGLFQPAQGNSGWNLDPAGYDFPFMDQLIQTLENEFCIDENRIFAYGFSFGGYMSNSLGCYRSNKIRGIGPVEGGLVSNYGPCMGPVAAVINHIDDDPAVTIATGRAARDHWLMASGCDPNSTMPYPPAPSGTGWTCVTYAHCQADHPVVWCEIATGGHGWIDPPADIAIWSFFQMLQ